MVRPTESVRFHQVTVACCYEPFDGDAFATLFRPFERVSPESHDITITGERIAGRVSRQAVSGLPPTFFLGRAQAYATATGYVVSDGYSLVESDFETMELRMRLSVEGERAFPGMTHALQHLGFGLLLRELGAFELHAAAVCSQRTAHLLVGDCRAGKTTTALALLAAGGRYLGDDRVLLGAGGMGVDLLSYPREFHVDERTAKAFTLGRQADSAMPTVDDKLQLVPWLAAPDRHLPCWHGPVALLFPRVADQTTTRVEKVDRAEAYGRLLASSAIALVEGIRHRDAQLALLKALADSASAYEVSLGRDLLVEPDVAGRRLMLATECGGQ